MTQLQFRPPAPALKLQLRDYQHAALKAIDAAEHDGIRRQLIALPTGTGKTVVFSELVARRGGRALILVHREELIRQTVEKLHLVAPALDVGVVKAGEDETAAQVVVASIQTLSRQSRLDQITSDFQTVVVDEAHHAPAESYRAVLAHVRAGEPDGPLLTGWTATPERTDAVGLSAVFDAIVYQATILDMIERGHLSDLRAVQIQLQIDLDAIHTRGGDFVESELDQALMAADATGQTVRAYQEHAEGRRALLFSPSVDGAHRMAAEFRDAGIPSEAVDGTTPLDERRAMLARFRRGETRVLANNLVLTEGFDDPGIECVIVARPTKSRPLYVQMIGRGTRRYPGKSDCLVLDLVGLTTRHQLVTTTSLFGLPIQLAGRTVAEAVAVKREVEQREAARVDRHGRLVAKTVELFKAQRLNWIAVGDAWILTTGTGQLHLLPSVEGWDVVRCERGQRPERLAEGVPLDYAQGIGEDLVREAGATALADRGAPWRRKPASDKQLQALARFGVRVADDLTSGAASDLLDQQIARMRGRR